MVASDPAVWGALQRAIAGEVIRPDSPGYDSARKPAMARFHDVRPAAVVRCRSAEDVAETIAFARRAGLPTTARSGGHDFAGRSSTTGVVIDVGPLSEVAIADGVATIGAGARLGDVYDALTVHGRTIAAGCGPEVGIAGLVLGGGLGILGRTHGLTSDQLLGAQVVLPDGRVAACDEQHDPDLFWALRGAGAEGVGIATSFAFKTLDAPPATSFLLTWPHAAAVALIDAWQRWAPDAPDALAASLLLTGGGVHVFGAMAGGEAETVALLDGLAADPASSDVAHLPYRETKGRLVELGPGEGDEQGHILCKSEFFDRPLPSDAIAALVAHFVADPEPGVARGLDFTPWAGAYNRVPSGATAFVHRADRFLLKHEVIVDTASADLSAARDWLARSWEIAHPFGTGRAYQNFPDPDLPDAPRAYYGANLDRLRRVQARYGGATS
jgi:FAD binding domain/Berberine and berberine like